MNADEKQAIQNYCDELSAHDQWQYGNTCAGILNRIDYEKPSRIFKDEDGRVIIEATFKDASIIHLGRSDTGWMIRYQVQPDKLCDGCSGVPCLVCR